MHITLKAVLLAAAVALAPTMAQAEPPTPTLSLTGEGTMRAVPDTVIISMGVVQEAETAGEALNANNEAMAKLLDALKAAGIADRDMGTSNFSIEPLMVYPQPRDDGTQEPPFIKGYRVSNQVTVKIREIGKAGGILDGVVRVGANQVQGIAFTVENDRALRDRARTEAMKDALTKAELYAEAAGISLVRILSLSEASDVQGYATRMNMDAVMSAAKAVPLAMGEQEIKVTVSVSWEIRPK